MQQTNGPDVPYRTTRPMIACTSPCAEREGAKVVTADQPFARLLRTNGMDRLVLSLEEIGSSAKDAKLD